jgi:hypothetical protein
MSSSEEFLKFLGHLSRRRSGGFCVGCLSFLYGHESTSEIRDYLRAGRIEGCYGECDNCDRQREVFRTIIPSR